MKRLVPNFLLKSLVSPPARGRGLKRCCDTSHTGAGESPPARGRGLKRRCEELVNASLLSPPARGRGLKLPTCHQAGKRGNKTILFPVSTGRLSAKVKP